MDVSLGRGVDLGVGLGAEVVGVGVGPVLVNLLVELAAVLEVLFLLDSGKGGDGSGVVIHSSTASTGSWRGKRQRRAGRGGHGTGDPAVDSC